MINIKIRPHLLIFRLKSGVLFDKFFIGVCTFFAPNIVAKEVPCHCFSKKVNLEYSLQKRLFYNNRKKIQEGEFGNVGSKDPC